MHVRDQSAFLLTDHILPLLQGCRIYAGEMHLGEVDPLRMRQVSTLSADRPISSLYPKRRYDKIRRSILKSFGTDIAHHDYEHPFLLLSALGESVLRQDHLLALDHYLWQVAEDHELQLTGLESFDDQLRIMEQIDLETSLKQLKDLARHPARYRRSVLKMVRLYEQQDIHQLFKSTKKQLHHLRPLLLYQRNERMAARVYELLGQDTLFATCGAAHLAGKKGVLRHLKQAGCCIRPIALRPDPTAADGRLGVEA